MMVYGLWHNKVSFSPPVILFFCENVWLYWQASSGPFPASPAKAELGRSGHPHSGTALSKASLRNGRELCSFSRSVHPPISGQEATCALSFASLNDILGTDC